eukprot:TRINITY_DN79992_c0_g1_i1.p1 TRINITY_DN79992_c0_g1~~TRINITY_DN79992_c0_g1_i1.p1  ORF type:complete len:671 (+),score=182.65 TRINITY_DN79992_c0_g1_i1:135-2147(+)
MHDAGGSEETLRSIHEKVVSLCTSQQRVEDWMKAHEEVTTAIQVKLERILQVDANLQGCGDSYYLRQHSNANREDCAGFDQGSFDGQDSIVELSPPKKTSRIGRLSGLAMSCRGSEAMKHSMSKKEQPAKYLKHAQTRIWKDADDGYFDEKKAAGKRWEDLRLTMRKSGVLPPTKGHWGLLHKLVGHPAFEACSAVIIMTHCLFVAAYVEWIATKGYPVHPVLRHGNTVLTIIFFFEVLIKAVAERAHFIIGQEAAWNVFDIVLLFIVVLDAVFGLTEASKEYKQIMTMGEIVRITRVLRIFRVLRFSQSLHIILTKVFNSVKTLFWVVVLTVILLFVASVCLTQGAIKYLQAPHGDDDDSYMLVRSRYGTVMRCAYTLFQSITGGLTWGDTADALLQVSQLYGLIFIAFIFLVIFAILNMITGVFVDAALENGHLERELMTQRQAKQDEKLATQLRLVFFEMDKVEDGIIQMSDFFNYLKDDTVSAYMRALHIDTSDAGLLFRLLDVDNSGEIFIDEFVEGCMKLKGTAKSMDLHIAVCECRRILARVVDLTIFCEERFDHLQETVSNVQRSVQAVVRKPMPPHHHRPQPAKLCLPMQVANNAVPAMGSNGHGDNHGLAEGAPKPLSGRKTVESGTVVHPFSASDEDCRDLTPSRPPSGTAPFLKVIPA